MTRFFAMTVRSPLGWGTGWFRQAKQHERRAVLTQIEAIVRTNAPLPEGLLKCSLDAPNARSISALRTLSERTESGMNLADAMQSMGGWFPPHYIAQVRAGEQTGQLASALASILSNINTDIGYGRTLRNHMVYFVAIVGIEVLMLLFLAARVFPVFMEILDEFGYSPAPLPARIAAAFSNFVTGHFRGIAAGFALLLLLLIAVRFFYRRSEILQTGLVALILQQRSAGNIFRRSQIQYLSRALELRLAGGTPLVQALIDTAAGLTYPYRRMLERCAWKVETGVPLSAALESERRLAGRELPELVRLGEMREDLVWSFREAVQQCTRLNRRSRHVWAEALVPIGVGLCAIGVFVAATAAFEMFAAMSDAIIADL